MKAMKNSNFADVKLKRTNRVKPLSAVVSSIRIHNEIIPVNTMHLFSRIMCSVDTKDLPACFQYELAPQPLSLFDESNMMRKCKKAILYEVLEKLVPCEITLPEKTTCTYVLDGGHMLHRVVWPSQTTYNDLYATYASYIFNHYGANTVVVFDGYKSPTCTKSEERKCRSRKLYSADIKFSGEMTMSITQEKFLANSNNKERFIESLSHYLESVGIQVKQATVDADRLIITTAVDLPHTDSNVVVVGDDIDLLLLLIALADKNVNIYFMKPGRGNIPKKLYSSQQLQQKLGAEMCNCILFFHAATGCDTTSALYRQGKKKAFTMLNNRELLVKIVQIFKEQEQTVSAITAAGEQFLLSVYGSPTSIKSLDLLRHYKFTRNTVSFPIQKPIHLAALPPTSAAAKQHSMRVYLQVQLWYGRELNPTDWGWKMQNNLLIPVTTDLAPAPISLLKLVSCNCKKECGKACGCRKAGLKCSQLCGICYGGECSNDEVYNDLESEDTDEEESHEHFHTENSNIAKKIRLTNDNDFYSQEFDSSED